VISEAVKCVWVCGGGGTSFYTSNLSGSRNPDIISVFSKLRNSEGMFVIFTGRLSMA